MDFSASISEAIWARIALRKQVFPPLVITNRGFHFPASGLSAISKNLARNDGFFTFRYVDYKGENPQVSRPVTQPTKFHLYTSSDFAEISGSYSDGIVVSNHQEVSTFSNGHQFLDILGRKKIYSTFRRLARTLQRNFARDSNPFAAFANGVAEPRRLSPTTIENRNCVIMESNDFKHMNIRSLRTPG